MKASLLFAPGLAIAISSIAPANAAPVHPTGSAPWVGCSSAAGFSTSSKPCLNAFNFKSYVDCSTGLTKLGNTSVEKWWYCTSLGLKN